MGISINGPSGIDTQYIIDQLVAIEQQKVTDVDNQKKAYQLKIDGYGKFQTLLTDLQNRAKSLGTLSSFDLFKTSSSNEDIVSITAGAGSVDGSYDVKVFQLAGNEKMISRDGFITDQNAALTSFGITAGTFSIDGTDITIDDNDTLLDLRQKINQSTDADGNRLDVSASVLKVADGNYRLVLTSKNSGSEGNTYADGTSNALEQLGIVDGTGNKGTTTQRLTSSLDIQSVWDGLAVGESVQITGKDHSGNDVNVAVVKRSADTDLLDEVNKAFNGMVNASFDGGTGQLVLEDRVAGRSQLSIDNFTIGADTYAFDTAYGDTGAGVLSVGKDAYFSVEDVYMSNSSNTATGFVNGVTFTFNGVSKDNENTNVSLERDIDSIRKKFQDMVDAYNALVRFQKTNTKVADPNDANSTSGNLAGDSTIRSVVSQINNFFHQQFNELNSTYTSFTMLGLQTDTASGELKIDNDMFNKAINSRYDEVVNLFITVGTSDNNGIVLGTSSEDTKAGNYVFEEVDDQHFRARLSSGSTWYTSESRLGDIISFEDGPLKGLSVTAPVGTIGAGNSATFTMSKGLSSIIGDAVTSMTDSTDGLVAMRTESYNNTIRRLDDKKSQLEDRIEKYRLRLVNQFSAMEQAMEKLKSQSANMLSQLGQSTSSSSSS